MTLSIETRQKMADAHKGPETQQGHQAQEWAPPPPRAGRAQREDHRRKTADAHEARLGKTQDATAPETH